jgi:hypothetical protein
LKEKEAGHGKVDLDVKVQLEARRSLDRDKEYIIKCEVNVPGT